MAARFSRWSARVAALTGSYAAFLLALLVVLGWALTGPLFGFSATWQPAVNTGTTVVTFLMVFLVQNTQNRDALAVHLKLDELIRALAGAGDDLMRAEDETDAELAALKAMYRDLVADPPAHPER